MQNLVSKLSNWKVPSNIEGFVQYDEYNIGQHLSNAANSCIQDVYEKIEFDHVLKNLLYKRRCGMIYELTDENTADEKTAEQIINQSAMN